ncbi:hypothetical protein ACF0H5_005291 [Mactra antiquata]
MAVKYLEFLFCILAALTGSGLSVTTTAGPTTTTPFPGPPLTYTCSQSDVNEIKLTLTVEDGAFTRQMVASDISAFDGEYGDCVSTFSPDSGIHTLVIIFDVDGVQKSPLRSQKNCYVQPVDANGDILVQVTLQRNPPYVVLGDEPRIVKCNKNNLSPTSVQVVDGGVDVLTNSIYNRQKEVAKTTLGDITASLVNLDSAPGQYFVGDNVKVVIQYNYALSQPAPRPIALFVRNLVVYGSEDGFNDRITYVTPNGCKGNGVQQSFRVTNYDIVNSITVSESATFKLKLFKKSRKAIIKLDFDAMCYTQGSPCQDQQDYCNLNSLSRKRRSVNDDSPLNGTLRLEVPILIPPISTMEGSQNQISGTDALECSVVSTNWILSIVLGALLLFVIAICIFLTLRLRTTMDKSVRIIDKIEGSKNEAFY